MTAFPEPFPAWEPDDVVRCAAASAALAAGTGSGSGPPRRSAVEERRVNELAGFLAHYYGYQHPRVKSACGLPPSFPRVPESPYAQRCAVCLDRYYGRGSRGGRVPYSQYGRWLLVPIRVGAGGGGAEAVDK
jgi:hypothetical protein